MWQAPVSNFIQTPSVDRRIFLRAVALSRSVGSFMHRRVGSRALYWRRVIHLGTLNPCPNSVLQIGKSSCSVNPTGLPVLYVGWIGCK